MNMSIDDFTLLSVIGRGTYAKVLLVKYKKTDEVFAMKVLKKKFIAEKKQQQHIQTERDVLASTNHPFLMKLFFSFQDQKKLYFVLQYCPGGELFGLLQAKNFISEEQAKFYSAQIVLALEALHAKNILYREQEDHQGSLKPENVLIDRRGYVKLTDFGLSKILTKGDEMATSVCGTPEYLAPQIIEKQGHGIAVDWWCLGCLIMEMVTGHPPYEAQNRAQLFEDIKHAQPKIPTNLSQRLQSLLKGLLDKNPKKRLGAKGPAEVKKHQWFQGTNWQAITNKTIKAPFVPVVTSETDTNNFDVQFTSTEIQSYKSPESLCEQTNYAGFSFQTGKAV